MRAPQKSKTYIIWNIEIYKFEKWHNTIRQNINKMLECTPYPVHARIRTPPAQWDTNTPPPHGGPAPAANAADGTHPTGMHSCIL